jgi:membrane-associated phospholipid phosphatase
MAFAVLVTRNHYTVDVLSAYLIGYAIYALSQWLFRLAKSQLPRASRG